MKVIPRQIIYKVLKFENKQEFYIKLGDYIGEGNIRFTKCDISRYVESDKLEIKINNEWKEVKYNDYIIINESNNEDIIITKTINNYIVLKEEVENE